MKPYLHPLILLSFLSLSACPGAAPPQDEGVEETQLSGRAPLNAGGDLYVVAHDDAYSKGEPTNGESGSPPGILYKGKINDSGHFDLRIGGARGRFTLIAKNGKYIEPANGTVAQHAGQSLRAALLDVKALEGREVAITPWTEMAYAQGGLEGYAKGLKSLSDMLNCQGPDHAHLLEVAPASPSDGIQSLTSGALSYLYLGAFSQIANDLSQQFGVPAGTRITSMWLTKVLAEDFADGHIDGRNKAGGVVYLLDGQPLPTNVLRQRFAQAGRQFLRLPASEARDWGNCSSIGETAVLDFLRCVSESTDLQLGAPGEVLDVEAPDVSILAPQKGDYLAVVQDLACEARDVSDLASLKGSLWRGDEDLSGALGTPEIESQSSVAWRWRAALQIEQVDTGEVQLRCEASDIWGNTRVEAHDFRVNRGLIPPELTLSADNPNEIASSIRVTCGCNADPYSHRCELTTPTDNGSLAWVSSGDRSSLYNWDTRAVLDGSHVLTCLNWTRGIDRPITKSVVTRVRNHSPGSATGTVFLDTPVEHVTVSAYGYENGQMGAELGTCEAPGGAFRVPITNEYRGPVLIVAEGSRNPAVDQPQALFQNVPLQEPMALGNGKVRLLLEHYEPGQNILGLSVNVASSMAESLAAAIWKQRLDNPVSFYSAAQTAHSLVDQYLSPTKPFDVRRTRVANLGSAGGSDEEKILGLFHVGLSRLAVEYSIQYCERRTCITVADIMEAMRRDLSDGQLDGLDINGAKIWLGNGAFLGEDFFRIELARAIRRWLDKAPFVDDRQETVNESGLVASEFTGRSQMLQHLAAHDSRIFGNRSGTRYDDNGPSLDVQVLGMDGRPLNLGISHGVERFRVVVDAQDVSGVLWIRATANGVQLENTQKAKNDHAEFWVDTTSLPDGEIQIIVESRDGNNNAATPHYIRLLVDKVPPKIELGSGDVWVKNGAYRLEGTVSKPHLSMQVFEGDTPLTEAWALPNEDLRFSIEVPIVCGAHHVLTVVARDWAGNIDKSSQTVHCDDLAPSVVGLGSAFMQEKGGAVVELTHRPQSEPIRLLDVGSAPILEKVWNRLDNRPNNNLPTIRFAVNDIAANGVGIGTPVGDLRASYKYVFNGAGTTKERDWAPVACSGDGHCEVPFSYQTMLPSDILALPVNIARSQNFIARSSVNDLHTVLIKVEDHAGNATVVEWSFRLKLFTPQVDLDCNFHPSFVGSRLAGSDATVPALANENFPSLYVNIGTSLDIDDASLTPIDAAHDFTFENSSLEWRLDGGTGTITGDPKPNWVKVPNADQCKWADWHTFFDDGECRRDRNPHVPRVFGWQRPDGVPSLLASQGIRPQKQLIQLRRGADQVHNPLFTVEKPRKFDGLVSAFGHVQSLYGCHETEIFSRGGWVMASNAANGGKGRRVLEQKFVKKLRIIRGAPYVPAYAGSTPGTPEPLRINYTAGCMAPITASWREDQAPLVYAGAPPSRIDVNSNYP